MRTRIAALIVGVVLQLFTPAGVANTDQNWESRFTLASGLNGEVFAMLSMGTNLYAGGAFGSAGVAGTGGIARWDGAKWNSVGGGIAGTVFAMVTDGTNLYAGGGFSSAGGVVATNVAKWDGTNWSSIGAVHMPDGLNPWMATVHTLLWNGSNLYAGGLFTSAGGVQATNVARWNGQTWTNLGNGLGVVVPYEIFRVYDLVIHHNELYATGLFHVSGETGVTNLARWTGTAWEQVGGGLRGGTLQVWWIDGILTGAGFALGSTPGGLLVGGDFTEAGGTLGTNLAMWDGTNWSSAGGGSDQPIARIVSDNTNQIVHGGFSSIGGIAANGVAQIGGSNYSALGLGVVPNGIAAARIGTNLFVAGNFQIAGGASAGFIARWDGVSWHPLSPGKCTAPLGSIEDLCFGPDGSLLAGGYFPTIGETRVNNIARYDGTNWSAFGDGMPGGNVRWVSVVGTNVYIGGNLYQPATGIRGLARWDGSQWASLSGGLDNEGYSPLLNDVAGTASNLYVAGFFKLAGSIPVTNLACWDGSQWKSLDYSPPNGIGPSCFVSIPVIATRGEELFICEQINCSEAGNTIQVRKRDGNQWMNVGSALTLANVAGVYSQIQAMTWVGSNLYVGGQFVITNGFTATNLLRWDGVAWSGMSNPFSTNIWILEIVGDATNLFVGAGASSSSEGPPVVIARWNGEEWNPLGSGVSSDHYPPYVRALALRGRDLFVGGTFTSAGGKPANNLALLHNFPEVNLSARGWQTNGHFGLRIHGGRNQLVRVQASTDLLSWNDLGTQLPDSDPFDFDELVVSPAMGHFYRLLLVP